MNDLERTEFGYITNQSRRRAFSARLIEFVSGHAVPRCKLKTFRLHLRVTKMTRDISELREELDKLSPKQKAELARTLIDSLDEELDENVEQLWLDEAMRRYEAYRRGEISSRPAAEVFARVRARLRR